MCREILGHKKHNYKEWITVDTLDKIQERMKKRQQLIPADQEQRKPGDKLNTQK